MKTFRVNVNVNGGWILNILNILSASLLIGIRDVSRIPAIIYNGMLLAWVLDKPLSVDFFKAKIFLTPIARSSQITTV